MIAWLFLGLLAGLLYLWISHMLYMHEWKVLERDIGPVELLMALPIMLFGPLGFVLALIPLMNKSESWFDE